MKKLFCALAILSSLSMLGLFISCKRQEVVISIPTHITDEASLISSVSDSLLTSEQKILKNKIFDIMRVSLKFENNKIVNKSKIEDFEKQGLSKFYYYLLEKNVEEVNNSDFTDRTINEVYNDIFNELNRVR